MNSIRKLIGPGLSLKKALLKLDRLSLDKKVRVINSLGKSVQLANIEPAANNNNHFDTKFTTDDVEFTFNSSLSTTPLRKLFSYTWLRDNCRCPKCYNYVADEIERDLHSLDENLKPHHFKSLATPGGENLSKIEITWNDGHVSQYDLNDLAKYAFSSDEDVVAQCKNTNHTPIMWNNESLTQRGGLDIFNYNDYLNNDSALKACFAALKRYGAVLVEGVPAEQSEIVKVTKRIGPIQTSHFGGGECVVTNNLEFIDRAYTNLSLKAHTDNAYMKNTAGLELFHVIKRPEMGGESLLVDGFNCALELKRNHRDDFDFLTTSKIESQFYKKGCYNLKYVDQVIKLNPMSGELTQVRFNPYHKVNLTHLSYDQINLYYKAIKNFASIVQSARNEHWVGLRPDQVLIFDNFRLLHGRSAFKGHRILVTSYLSRDDWLSKAEVMLE